MSIKRVPRCPFCNSEMVKGEDQGADRFQLPVQMRRVHLEDSERRKVRATTEGHEDVSIEIIDKLELLNVWRCNGCGLSLFGKVW